MLLFHRQTGSSGDRLPLVLLHGLLGSSRNWQSTGADLATERALYTLDLRNHGSSPHAEPMTYPAMADDVLRWLDGHGITRCHLIGHSMGGKVAMRLACDQPARIASLGVVDIAPRDYHSNAHRLEFAAMNELDLRTLSSRAEAELRLEARVSDWAMRKFLVTNLEREAQAGAWRWIVNLPVLTAALSELEKNPLGPLDRFDGPCCFWRGARSSYLRDEDWPPVAGWFRQAQLVTIQNSGHNPHMEARPAFVSAVRAFLGDLP